MFDRVKVTVEKSSLDSLREVCAGRRWGVLRLLVFGAIGAALGDSVWLSFYMGLGGTYLLRWGGLLMIVVWVFLGSNSGG